MENQKIKDILTKRVERIIEKESLSKKLKSGQKLIIKNGIDPTSPDLHLGHLIVLKKLKEFQDLGHQVVLILGDFTAQIGDPSGRKSARKALTKREIDNNLKTYLKQVGMVLDLKKIKVFRNSRWYSKMNLNEFLKIARFFTLSKISQREDFKKRIQAKKEVYMHEVLYQILQAYDSVKIKADLEIGGRDQLLNMLAGRSLMKSFNLEPQDVMTLPLLIGLDGKDKMSKSKGNYIGFLEKPEEKFAKIMSIPDSMIISYFELLTDIPEKEILKIKKAIEKGKINPLEIKEKLAFEIVSELNGKKSAEIAKREFEKVFRKRQLPSKMPIFVAKKRKYRVLDLLFDSKVIDSKTQGKRLISQGAVKIDNQKVKDFNKLIEIKNDFVIKIGKRKFLKVKHN